MNASEVLILHKRRRGSVSVSDDGTQLLISARKGLTKSAVEFIRPHKAEILHLLKSSSMWADLATWTESAFEEWDERAAFIEYLDNQPRERAESVAYHQIAPKVHEARVQRKAG